MATAIPTILFLGATGGCALNAMIKSLENGHNCIALVRTESKLTNLLTTNNVSSDVVAKHLTILTGDVKNAGSLKKAIFNETLPNGVVDIIVSGLGSIPVFTPNPLRPTLQDPTICQDAAAEILSALKSGLKPGMSKPLLIAVSTTGMSDHGRDIPLAMIPLYHWMLPVPHADKKKMEQIISAEAARPDSAISGFVMVRASLLIDGPLKGVDAIRHDTEREGKVASKAIGYMISRKDVGNWIFVSLIQNKSTRDTFLNQFVGITY